MNKVRNAAIGATPKIQAYGPASQGAQVVRLKHMAPFGAFKNVLAQGFYHAIGKLAFLVDGNTNYPTYGANDKIDIIFNIPSDLVEPEKTLGKRLTGYYALAMATFVPADEATSVVGREWVERMSRTSPKGLIGRIPPEHIDLIATIDQNERRTTLLGEGRLDKDTFIAMCEEIRGSRLATPEIMSAATAALTRNQSI
ncbi:hypothetical protein A2311_02630 [candidate division WOR-1 bacterium RIFOXYB2_FULL_48_7]|uniref:Uncharacterized protein n=1 Tax=candidate division WOR-1 bacterium RIFOXYB2_FULL_48_7 TaxID=1802583 RepID=A0A1F4TR90_UNCSA|nr:MAG: hypothetical protein A2311_02630 [candidate division WOR-1 bacterium RIFOXYB2_FULL_48_7]